MPKHPNKKVFAVLSDLFFTAKISAAAKLAGMDIEFIKSDKEVLARAKESLPPLIILDLNFDEVQPLKLIGKIKSNPELKKISLVSYLSHVQGDLKQQAHDAGCDMVLAKSAFSQNLPQILKRHAGNQ